MKTKSVKDFVWTKSSIVCLIIIFLAAMMLVFLSFFFHLNFAHFIKGVGRTDLFGQICNLKILFLTTKKSMTLCKLNTEDKKLDSFDNESQNNFETKTIKLQDFGNLKQSTRMYKKTGQSVLFL